jgi:hypothetical protein
MRDFSLSIVKDTIADRDTDGRTVSGTLGVFIMCVMNHINQEPDSVNALVKGSNIDSVVDYHIATIKESLQSFTISDHLTMLSVLDPMYKRCDHLPSKEDWDIITLGLQEWYVYQYKLNDVETEEPQAKGTAIDSNGDIVNANDAIQYGSMTGYVITIHNWGTNVIDVDFGRGVMSLDSTCTKLIY